MKAVRIFTHDACEPPVYLLTLLDSLGYPYEVVCLFKETEVAMDLDNVSSLVFMGGAGSVQDPTDSMKQELKLIQRAHEKDIPMLGICLGAQLISQALGGCVFEADKLEVGWHQVRILERAREHHCFQKLPDQFTVFQWHAHTFLPPQDAVPLMTSDCTACQAFSLGQHLALQFHLEMDEKVIRGLLETYASDIQEQSDCVQNAEFILQNITAKTKKTFAIADSLLTPWFDAVYKQQGSQV